MPQKKVTKKKEQNVVESSRFYLTEEKQLLCLTPTARHRIAPNANWRDQSVCGNAPQETYELQQWVAYGSGALGSVDSVELRYLRFLSQYRPRFQKYAATLAFTANCGTEKNGGNLGYSAPFQGWGRSMRGAVGWAVSIV